MCDKINLNINSNKVTLNEEDILDLIQIMEGYFDGSDPKRDFYFSALARVVEKIHNKNSPFWTIERINKIQLNKKRN